MSHIYILPSRISHRIIFCHPVLAEYAGCQKLILAARACVLCNAMNNEHDPRGSYSRTPYGNVLSLYRDQGPGSLSCLKWQGP